MLRDMNKTRDKKRIRAVIFDMDGVISDTQNIHSAIESELLKGYGVTINPEEITRKYAGTRMKEWMPDVFKHHHVSTPSMEEISAKKKVHLENALKEGIREVPGTREFIQFLKEKNIPIAVASASRLALIDLILTKLDLKKEFDAIASSEEVKMGKPEPDVFLLAARVGGIYANRTYTAEFIYQNLTIQSNVIHAAYIYGVKKLIFSGGRSG